MKKKVVIIGGGFAGSDVAKKLEKELDVTLIDTKNYFEFTPGVLRTIVEPEHINKIQVLHSDYLKSAKIIVGKVDEVSKEYVLVGKKKVYFDYLVISSGSSYNSPFKEQRVVIASRAENLEKYYGKLLEAKNVLIVGGGLVGVELAGEILWKYQDKKITIVNSNEKLIQRNNERAVRICENFLKKRGVEIIHNEIVEDDQDGVYFTNKGREIEPDIVFLCTGITPNYDFMAENFSSRLNAKRQIETNEFLQLESFENIFAAGDVAGFNEEKTAQNAQRQARVVAGNILALERKIRLSKYKPRTGPLVISLGKWNGIFTYRSFTFGGIVPAMMKAVIEKREMRKRRCQEPYTKASRFFKS